MEGKTEPGAKVYLFCSHPLNPGQTPVEPTLQELIDGAAASTTADGDGNFRMSDIDFEHCYELGLDRLTPEEVPPGLLDVDSGAGAELEQQERTVRVWLAVVDGAGREVGGPLHAIEALLLRRCDDAAVLDEARG